MKVARELVLQKLLAAGGSLKEETITLEDLLAQVIKKNLDRAEDADAPMCNEAR